LICNAEGIPEEGDSLLSALDVLERNNSVVLYGDRCWRNERKE
jgi:hypothetical protein